MNLFFKTFVTLIFSISFASAFAAGNCEGKASVHEGFCLFYLYSPGLMGSMRSNEFALSLSI